MVDKMPHVLIVDDDIEMQTLYDLYLHGSSFETKKAANGQEALNILAKEKFDLIILDMIMPVLDGEGFLRKMHEDPSINKIPVIIASVNEKIPQDIQEFKNIYTNLKKPFNVDKLIKLIRAAIKQPS